MKEEITAKKKMGLVLVLSLLFMVSPIFPTKKGGAAYANGGESGEVTDFETGI